MTSREITEAAWADAWAAFQPTEDEQVAQPQQRRRRRKGSIVAALERELLEQIRREGNRER